jgi:hypothetical protein
LVERRLINVLLLNAYDALTEANKTHTISVPLLLETLDWSASKNIDTLRESLTKLATTAIVFDGLNNGQSDWSVVAPLSFARIHGGVCSYRYDEELSRKLADPAMYAKININIQNQFDSAYALALYENCYRFHKVGTTGQIDLDVWRELLGAQAGVYDEFKYLSQRVLKPAITAVNAVSNVTLEMKVIREGRKVVALKFNVSEKAQRSIDEVPDDPEDEVRKTEAFKLLSQCNIGARLAIQWIRRDPTKALRVARETLDRDAKKQIRTRAGYARASFENAADVADVEPSEPPAPTVPAALTDAEREKDAKANRQRDARAKFLTANKARLVADFTNLFGATSYSQEKGAFTRTDERLKFNEFVTKAMQTQ